VFVVASFGSILPKTLLDIPKHGTVNVHPSLLPRLRGPSPMRSAILRDEKETGVSIMLLDEQMDHGPLLAQKKVFVDPWPSRGRVLDDLLAREGGALLAKTLPLWVAGEIEPQEQNHDLATYTEKFTKEDGLLDLKDNPYRNLLKVRAFEGWPGTYALFERAGKRIRVQILDAHLDGSRFVIDIVKPEGKKEMPYEDFLRSGAKLTY
jgi:methionyl-tRNA formyltransferase